MWAAALRGCQGSYWVTVFGRLWSKVRCAVPCGCARHFVGSFSIYRRETDVVQFTDNAIQSLFGNEAAENESIARLRQYYVKSDPFEMMTGEAPLRILVGHKGIGKSALVKVALAEAAERGEVAILVRPDDIHGVAAKDADIPELIREWKDGLTTIIAKKVVECIGGSSGKAEITAGAAQVMEVIASSISLKSFKMSLDPARKAIAHRFLKSQRVVVYLDDLDRGWEGRRADLKRISALLNAARDMSSDSPGLMFRIALRTDVYYLVRTSDESTDKVEGSVVWYSWTNHEIMLLLIKRIETFFGRNVNETALRKEKQRHIARYLDNVFSRRFEGQGHWANAPTYKVLMSLVRKRPRDLVKLCTAAARVAGRERSELIVTKHLESVFEDYSRGRIQDSINEYRSEMPEVERLLVGMKPTKRTRRTRDAYLYDTGSLLKKLRNIMQGGRFRLTTGREASERELASFLYKTNFLIARKELESGYIVRRYFEENRYLSSTFADFGFAWEVHPAYRWALQPDNVWDILNYFQPGRDDDEEEEELARAKRRTE